MNKTIHKILIATALLSQSWLTAAQADTDIDTSLSLTYASKYIWRGYDIWNDRPALQPDLFVDLSEFSVYGGVWGSFALDDDCVDGFGDRCSDWNELDYYLGYYTSLKQGQRLQTEVDISYTYFDFYRQSNSDTQEIGLVVKHPELIKSFGTPYWALYYGWPVSGSGHSNYVKLGLESAFTLAGEELTTVVETIWDDGAGGFGDGEGISHLKLGAAKLWTVSGIDIEPRIYYQWAFNDKVNDEILEDEYWFEISIGHSF